MKVIVVYDSVSKTRMTEKVAVIIQDGLKEKGIDAEALHVNQAGGVDIDAYDCLIIGSPTMGWKPTKETVKFLDGLKGKNVTGKFAASFDTQMRSFMSGNANKAMDAQLRTLGFKIVKDPLLAYVHGGKNGYQFRDGEPEKVKEWAKGLVDAMGVK
jgi:flavodoxin